MGCQEFGGVQQREVPSSSSAPGEETTPCTRTALETEWLKKSLAKKELGVLLDEKMNESAINVSICLRLHQEIIPSKSGKVIIPLYSALVEGTSCIQFWAQQYKKNVDLKWVQGKAMKIKGLKNWLCWISWDCSSWGRLGREETYQIFYSKKVYPL